MLNQSTVEYREVMGFPGYRIGSDQSVWSRWRRRSNGKTYIDSEGAWHKLTPTISKTGYYHCSLCRDGKSCKPKIHKLLLESFVCPRPIGAQCRHLDGNKLNNTLSNLKWGTPKENQADRIRHGTSNDGIRCNKAKLTVSQVKQIRAMASRGYAVCELAKKFPVSHSTISKVINRITWRVIKP